MQLEESLFGIGEWRFGPMGGLAYLLHPAFTEVMPCLSKQLVTSISIPGILLSRRPPNTLGKWQVFGKERGLKKIPKESTPGTISEALQVLGLAIRVQ